MNRASHWLCLLALISCITSNAQSRPIYLGLKFHPTGSILPHSQEIRSLANTRPRGFQIEASRFNISQKSWESCHCFARTGIAFSVIDYGNPNQLGQSNNLYLFVEPYLKTSGRLMFSYRAGMGFSYLTKTFDEINNPENLFFSSPISGLLMVGVNANYHPTPNWALNTGISYYHISNRGIQQPNLGMNFPMLTIGVDHILRASEESLPSYSRPELDRRTKTFAKVIWTNKTTEEDDQWMESVDQVLGVELGLLKPIGLNHGLSIGFEILSDGSWSESGRRDSKDYSPLSASILAGHHFLIGQFSFSQQIGIYTLKDFPNTPDDWYQRYGLSYMANKNIQLGFTLKAHGHVAEILDLRLGWVF